MYTKILQTKVLSEKKTRLLFPPCLMQNWTYHNLGQKHFKYFLPGVKHFTGKPFLRNQKTNTQPPKQYKSKPFIFQMLIKK